MALRDKQYTITADERYLSDGPYFPQSRQCVKEIAIYRHMQDLPYYVYRLDKDGFIEFNATMHFRGMAREWKLIYDRVKEIL